MTRKLTAAIVVFPGSNCDQDCVHVVSNVMGQTARTVWHKESSLGEADVVILPGGFSYGDYLRCGAIAKYSPIMKEVVKFADSGRPVLGICNGFQILVEAGLLPGVLIRNQNLKFICDSVSLRIASTNSLFTSRGKKGEIVSMPIAHMEGNYFIDNEGLKKITDNDQIVFQYSNRQGEVDPFTNPNGSLSNIAGIVNERRNVMGMMPHPERVCEKELGSDAGRIVFESLIGGLL